jgi:hypothetical protein
VKKSKGKEVNAEASFLLIGETMSSQGFWNTLLPQTVIACYVALSKTSTLLAVPSFCFMFLSGLHANRA